MGAVSESVALEKDAPSRTRQANNSDLSAAPTSDTSTHSRIVSAVTESPTAAAQLISQTGGNPAVLQRAQRSFGNRASQQIVMRARAIQRKCDCGGTCEKCQEEEGQRVLQRSAADQAPPVFNGIPSSQGEPLNAETLHPLETHFQSDLSDVRVHTNTEAAESATALDAHAYTTGRDIYFAPGMYAPTSASGKRLLTHEVAHVVQQSSGKEPTVAMKSAHGIKIGAPDDILETEADQAADGFMADGDPATKAREARRGRSNSSDPTLVQLQTARSDLIQRDPDANQTATVTTQQQTVVAPPVADSATAQAATTSFPITIMPKDPDWFVVPETATRAGIAERLFGDATRESAFFFPVTAPVPSIANLPGKAVRVTSFAALVEPARLAMQDALDAALAEDIRTTVSVLSQRLIGSGSESQLSEITLRWSNRSDLFRRDGANYFAEFLSRLSQIKLTEDHVFWTTEKTALEWLLIEAESTREQVQKAITLRSSFNVDYQATEGAGEFPAGSIIGRFYYGGGSSLQIAVVSTIAESGTFDSALMEARNASWLGLRAVVPGPDPTDPKRQVFRAYALLALTVNDPLVKQAQDDPGGHYYWYHPGTVMVPFLSFEKDFARGGEPEQRQRRSILSRALQDAATLNSFEGLLGLDYDVLSTATVEERIDIIDYALKVSSVPNPASALIARVITSASPADRRALEQNLRDGDQLDAIIKIPDPQITAALGPTTSEQEETALDRLEGGEDLFDLYKKWLEAVISKPPATEETTKFASQVKLFGFADIADFRKAIADFEDTFQRFAVQVAFQMLDENEALAKGEFARYSGPPSGGGIADLRNELGTLRPQAYRRNYAIQDRDAAHDRAVQLRPAAGISEEYQAAAEVEAALNQRADKEIAATDEMVKGIQAHFPVLSDPSLDVTGLIEADDKTLQNLLQNTALARLTDIAKARSILSDDPSEVWKLEGVVSRARVQMGLVEGSIFDRLLRDKEKREQHESIFKSILLAALSLGLAIFGGPIGLVIAAGISTYTAATHIQEYVTKQIMVGTAFDRAQALSADEPSLFWLALDIVGAIVDASAAVKAMTALKPLVKETLVITDAVKQAEKLRNVETVAKSLESGQRVGDVSQAAAKSADTLAQDAKVATHAATPPHTPVPPVHPAPHQLPNQAAQKVVTEAAETAEKTEGLASKVVADLKQRIKGEAALANLGEEGKALIILCKGDAAAASGLARIESGARAGIVAALKDSPDAARLLGNLAAESDAVANSAEKLFKAFVTEGKRADQFEAILKKYFIVRGSRIRKASMLRALGEAGLEDADYARLAEQMKTLSATKNVQTEFSKKAIAAIAEKLPPGGEGIRKITEMSKWMETSAKGSVFEQWCREHIFQGMKRFSEETAGLPGKYTRTLLHSDGVLTQGSELTVVELKNYVDTLPTFAKNTAEGRQLANYAELIRPPGVIGPGGLPFTKVNYVFSTEEAAKLAAPNIRAVLGDNAIIHFINPENASKVLLN